MFIHDLKPQDVLNFLLKYADDVSLLCPQNSGMPIELEMAHVLNWARENKMTVNLLKTVKLVFRRPNISDDLIPSATSDVRRVAAAKQKNKKIRKIVFVTLLVINEGTAVRQESR